MKFNGILMIDDDEISNYINLRILTKIANREDIEVRLNGETGLEYIKQCAKNNSNKCPELILLDLHMPVMDGIEFLELFTKEEFSNKPKVNILVLTTSHFKKDMDIILQYPNVKYILKPLTDEKLMAALNNF